MKVYSNNILKNGYMDDDFGENSKNSENYLNGRNARSFHIGWDEIPEKTKTLAIIFLDYDSIPVCGFPFLHWSLANLDPSIKELKENASIQLREKLIQGRNSTCSAFFNADKKPNLSENTALFIGCAPPNGDHIYTVKVYAVSKVLSLKNGFYVNELINQLRGNVLEKSTLLFKYKQVRK